MSESVALRARHMTRAERDSMERETVSLIKKLAKARAGQSPRFKFRERQ